MINSRLVWVGGFVAVAAILHGWLSESANAKEIRADFVEKRPPVMIDEPQPNPGYSDDDLTERVRLPTDRTAARKIEEVYRLVKEESWAEAAQLLQVILDEPDDKFFKDEKGRWVSVRGEANRIISTMPKQGVQFYEQKVGLEAKKALEEAKKKGDPALYADVALRYMHTTAGAEAAMFLGTHHLDQGRYVVAALCFERLLQREGQLDKFNALMLYKAIIAFERAGDKKNSEKVWATFVKKLGDKSLPPSVGTLKPQDLKDIASIPKENLRPGKDRFDWPMFAGESSRNALSEGDAPFLDPRWSKDTATSVSKQRIDPIFSAPVMRARARLGGYHPIAVAGMIIYRSYKGIHAYNIKTGQLEWEFSSKVGLEQCLASSGDLDTSRIMEQQWINAYTSAAQNSSIFYDNSLLGTLSTDNERAYMVEDIAIPPPPSWLQQMQWQPNLFGMLGAKLQPWMAKNELRAFDIHTGKLAWEIGTTNNDQDPFNDTFFLGAPLPIGDKLYVLVEVNGQLQLLCLHCFKEKMPDRADMAHKVVLQWRHVLCDVEKRFSLDATRRTQACHLSYADGMMICPTNCGAVLAVDLLTRTTVWAKSYGEPANDVGTGTGGNIKRPGAYPAAGATNSVPWASSAPIVQNGRVVFTAPDGKALYCLSLRNGDHLWSISKTDNDLYLAGIYDKNVMVVGKETCRAISIETGKDAWSVALESPPSGRGVAASTKNDGNVYFLPLKKGAVMAINLQTRATAVSRSPKGEVPGNLIFHDGDVLSQGVYNVHAYPQLEVKEQQMNLALEKNPNDPFGLTERGELRLYQGKLEQALTDLNAALANKPEEPVKLKARTKLYETLSGLLDRHFTKYEGDIKALEELIPIPEVAGEKPEEKVKRAEDERDRWARFHRMVAKGKEEQAFDPKNPDPKKLVEAFQAYLKFAGLGHNELIPIPEEPGTRVLPELWAQGRIHAMLKKANDDEKKIIEEALKKEWEKTEKAGSVDALRAFVSLFGPVSEQGQKAKLLLAEKLMANNDMLEAENKLWSLYQSDHERKSALAAQALDSLARMYTRQGDLENATYYFGLLSKNYPKLQVRDGKTGDELFQELAMDKRFLAFLEGGGGSGGWVIGEKIKATSSVGNFNQQQFLWLMPNGEIPPSYRKYRVGMNFNAQPNVMMRLQDRSDGKVLKEFPMQGLRPNINFWDPKAHTQINFNFVGRTMVFQWGHWVYGFDPVQQKELWRFNTLGLLNPNANGQLGPNMYVYIQVQPNGIQELWYQDGSRERIGHLVMADANCACFLVKDEGLVAVDPSTGQKRWVKSDISVGTEMFGDGEYLFMLSGEGGKPQVIRTLDGGQVPIQDFSKAYKDKIKISGRNILLKETDKDKGLVLRMYDIITGKDVWKKEFGADAIMLNCQSTILAGAIDAKGKVTVFRIDSGKDVVNSEVDVANINPKSMPTEVHLLEDGSQYYVIFNQVQKNDAKNRIVQPHGLLVRNVMINGNAIAFDKNTGKEKWKREMPAQQLAVDQFEDNPLLLCCSWVQQFENQGNPPIPVARRQVTHIYAVDKRNGEVVYDTPDQNRAGQQYHTLKLDPKNGVIELQSYNHKIAFKTNDGDGKAAAPEKPMDPVRPPKGGGFQPGGGGNDPAELKQLELKLRQLELQKQQEQKEEAKRLIDEIIKDKEGIDIRRMEDLRKIRGAIEKKDK